MSELPLYRSDLPTRGTGHESRSIHPLSGLRPVRPGRARLGMTLEPLQRPHTLGMDVWTTRRGVEGVEAISGGRGVRAYPLSGHAVKFDRKEIIGRS